MISRTIALLLLCSIAVAETPTANTITIGVEEWYPVVGDPYSSSPGFMVEINNQIFSHVQYKQIPWKRALAEARSHRIDCVLGAGGKDLIGLVTPQEHWGSTHFAVYTRHDDHWIYKQQESLLQRHVGVVDGYSYTEQLNTMIASNPQVFKAISSSSALVRNIKLLLSDRIDTFIDDTTVTQHMLHQLGLTDRVKLAGYLESPEPLFLACSPKQDQAKKLIQRAHKALPQLRASGKFDEIMSKYGLSHMKP